MLSAFEVLWFLAEGILIIYVGWIIWLIWQWQRTVKFLDPSASSSPATVVVAARNEAAVLPHLIQSLLAQSRPLPLIIVDDHSTDETLQVAQNYPQIKSLSLPDHLHGKKAALTLAIEQSSTEYILTTDADITMNASWTTQLTGALKAGAMVITGPLLIPEGPGWLHNLQKWDLLAFAGITAAGIKSGKYMLGNGANLAFTKTAFHAIGGYAAHSHWPGGDDVFTIAAIARKYPGQVAYAQHPQAIVYTAALQSWRALLHQRRRWGAKMSALVQPWLWFLVLTILSVHGCWALFFLAAWIKPVFWWFFCWFTLIKLSAEYVYLYTLARFAHCRLAWWEMLWISPVHGLFLWVTALASLGRPAYQWKGRQFGGRKLK